MLSAGPARPPAPPQVEMRLASIVTAPVWAYRLPVLVAPVFTDMEALARMLPMKLVADPSVALLPIAQVMLLLLHGFAPPISLTAELLAVISVLPVLMTQAALGLPLASSVSVPVSPTVGIEKQMTPGGSVTPPRSGLESVTSHGWLAACVYAVWASAAAVEAGPRRRCGSCR